MVYVTGCIFFMHLCVFFTAHRNMNNHNNVKICVRIFNYLVTYAFITDHRNCHNIFISVSVNLITLIMQ